MMFLRLLLNVKQSFKHGRRRFIVSYWWLDLRRCRYVNVVGWLTLFFFFKPSFSRGKNISLLEPPSSNRTNPIGRSYDFYYSGVLNEFICLFLKHVCCVCDDDYDLKNVYSIVESLCII